MRNFHYDVHDILESPIVATLTPYILFIYLYFKIKDSSFCTMAI